APLRNHPLLLLSGVATNAIGYDLSPEAGSHKLKNKPIQMGPKSVFGLTVSFAKSL
ncbi:hypothetical protein L195_g053532, partial [Trifolium pratense]